MSIYYLSALTTGLKVNIITKATLACRNIYRISNFPAYTPDRKIQINITRTIAYLIILKVGRKISIKNESLSYQLKDCYERDLEDLDRRTQSDSISSHTLASIMPLLAASI